jgi:hypothetical protein
MLGADHVFGNGRASGLSLGPARETLAPRDI